MPIYEYKCQECEKVFDVLQKLNSDPVETCINCGGKVEKLISASSFQFKGNGWYVTDYGGAKNKESNSKKTNIKSKEPKTTSKKTTASKD